jgi:uncharacterized protein
MKIVLDTNVLLIPIPFDSPYRPIIEAVRSGHLHLGVTTEILLEYEELLARNSSPIVADNIMKNLEKLENVQKIRAHFNWHLIPKDADDNKYVDCAVAFSADYLVTEDKHFAVLKKVDFPKINVINADQFLEILKKSNPT